MTWVAGFLIALFTLGAVRNRGRLGKLNVLPDGDREPAERHRFPHVSGVEIDEDTKRAASAYAEAAGIEVLDLVPGDWSAIDYLGLAELIDPAQYRGDPLAPGRTSGHAMLVHADVLDRAEGAGKEFLDGGSSDPVAFARAAMEWKRCAPHGTGVVVAPGLKCIEPDLSTRSRVLALMMGDFAGVILLLQVVIYALVLVAIFETPWWGLAALVAFHMQATVALSGRPFGQRDLGRVQVMRFAIELRIWWETMRGAASAPEDERVTALRPIYDELLGEGPEKFLNDIRDDCPLCGARELTHQITLPDFYQHKPGRFQLDRCVACGHVFQNPSLTAEGLNYYYRDFYDGLSADKLDFIFSFNPQIYPDRARLAEGHTDRPRRWLDVGGGHGHFCLMAKDVWPETQFDVLDLSDSARLAELRGWASSGFNGLFPELAPQLRDTYDVVSMSHYLEHTTSPERELAAAKEVLSADGLLMIEVPDPECRVGRWLGWAWLPWFQPQHLRFLTVDNLREQLDRNGFEPLVWEREEAHQTTDLCYAVLVILSRLSPPPDSPWLPPTTWLRRLSHHALWLAGLPFLLLSMLLDKVVLVPFVRRFKLSNTYRVLARRRA